MASEMGSTSLSVLDALPVCSVIKSTVLSINSNAVGDGQRLLVRAQCLAHVFCNKKRDAVYKR